MTKRRQLAVLGNNLAIRVLRFISLLSRSSPLVVRMRAVSRRQCKLRKAFGQIRLGSGCKFGMRAAPDLNGQAPAPDSPSVPNG